MPGWIPVILARMIRQRYLPLFPTIAACAWLVSNLVGVFGRTVSPAWLVRPEPVARRLVCRDVCPGATEPLTVDRIVSVRLAKYQIVGPHSTT